MSSGDESSYYDVTDEEIRAGVCEADDEPDVEGNANPSLVPIKLPLTLTFGYGEYAEPMVVGAARTCSLCLRDLYSPAGSHIHRCPTCRAAQYCSEAHATQDAWRHRDECAVMVELLSNTTPQQTEQVNASMQRVGIGNSTGTDSSAVQHPSTKLGRVTIEGVERVLPMVAGRSQVNPIEAFRRATNTKDCCSQPWVSSGPSGVLTVSWLPPKQLGRFPMCGYHIQVQQVFVPESANDCMGETPWEGIGNPHEGYKPAHAVKGLEDGKIYRFRVKHVLSGPLPAGLEGKEVLENEAYSMASDPFMCGPKVTPYSGVVGWACPDRFSEEEMQFFMTLTTPGLIQEYLDSIPMNHELETDTCLGPLGVVRQNHGHCIEGALLGAYILMLHGTQPCLVDLRSSPDDDDHNVVPFQVNGRWGCLSVSNHASLRYRNPVYKSIREMCMSYFDDYMNNDGTRTLRTYSRPVNLNVAFGNDWPTSEGDVYHIAEFMDRVQHYKLIEEWMVPNVRSADEFMMETTISQREWPPPENLDPEQMERNLNK